MLKKTSILFLLIFLFFVNNCGFTPQYAGFKGLNFSLNINNLDGDRDLNNALKSQLDRYNLENPELRQINLDIKSKFTKDILSKDTTGKATKYNLKANVKFILMSEETTEEITFDEEFKIDKIEDNIEENNYIRIIKRDFAEIISEKLILSINKDK
tara:strand:+ start:140 stop:607 length:468 start_codon:yes stop_codon:yes gene_type:complete